MKSLEQAAREAYDLRQRERRFLQGFGDHGLTKAQIEALRARRQRALGLPLYTVTVGGKTRIVSIPED